MIDMDTLFVMAEISIGIAGFSAIILVFKKTASGTWYSADANRFQGMLMHAVLATMLSFVPSLVAGFTPDPEVIWTISSTLLALTTLVHTLVGIYVERYAPIGNRIWLLMGGSIVILLQILNLVDFFPGYPLGPYMAGIYWHMLAAALLFIRLVWIPESDIEA